MSLDLYLYPNDVRNQSDAMMRKMTEDNEAYHEYFVYNKSLYWQCCATIKLILLRIQRLY